MRKDPTEFRKRFAAYKAGKMPYRDGKIVDWEEDTDYGIPFDESKRVRLTDAGYATGAVLSTNMLDSIADNAIKAGLPIRTAMGLAVKESTLGNPTDDRSARTLLSAKNKALWANAGYGLHINEYGDYVSARDLINWWKDLEDARYGKSGRSALEGGFEFYKNNPRKYNPGQPNHPQLVEKRAKELMKSPLIQLWQKNRSQNQVQQLKAKNFNEHWLKRYEDGKSPRKLEYHPEGDYYYGGKVFPGKELVVTGVNRKQRPYWVTAKTKQLQPSELMAPLSLVGSAVDKIPVVGPAFNEYVAPALSLGNWVAGTGNPYKGAEIRANDERQLGAWLPLDFIGLKAPGKVKSTISYNIQPTNIYKGFRRLGIPQTASKELLLAPDLAYKRFKNLDIFDKVRGIKYTDNVYHGSRNSFDINNAKTYSSVRHDTGFHLGSSETPAYSRANGILGGTLYSGKLKLKEEPFEIRDLNTWDIDAIGGEAYNNPAFMQYLKKHGIDVDDLLQKGYEMDHEYNSLNALELEEYLTKHGGMLSDKYLADLFKKHNINLKYKNEFETFSNTPEYSYAIYNPDNVVWNRSFKFSKKPEVLEKLKKLGIAKDYLLPDYHIDLPDLYTTLQSFPEFKLPQIRKN